MATIGSFNSNLGLVGKKWLNWRPGETLRWKVKTVGWGRSGSGSFNSNHAAHAATRLPLLHRWMMLPALGLTASAMNERPPGLRR
jgi:hypothetical protein